MISQTLGFSEKNKGYSKYTTAYHGIDLLKLKTLTGGYFKAEYSQIFRMSKDFDPPKNSIYTVFVTGDGIIKTSRAATQGLVVKSEEQGDQASNHLRFVANSDSRASGEGNFPHPLIF
jgi:hypothetical protein